MRSVKLVTVGRLRCRCAAELRARCARASSRASVLSRRRQDGAAPGRAGPGGGYSRPVAGALDVSDHALATQAARAQVAAATTQRDLAAADFERFSKLKAQNFISGAELDRREAQLKSAQAQLDQARPNWSRRATRPTTRACWPMPPAW